MLLGAANLTRNWWVLETSSWKQQWEVLRESRKRSPTDLYPGSREVRTWQRCDKERCSPPPLHSKWNPEKHMLSQGEDQRQISWAFMTQALEQKLFLLFTKTCHLPLGNRKTVFFSFLNLNGAMWLILTNAALAEDMSAFACPKV